MKIGIIGAGNIGSTLARRLAGLDHEVSISNSRGPQTLEDITRETEAKAVTVEDAARNNDLVVVTIPMKNVPDLPKGLFDGAHAVVVVDTCNYYPQQRDGRIEAIEEGMPESRWVERQIGRPVIKAFNNIRAQHLSDMGLPAGAQGRVALPVAGDDPKAKKIVLDLVEELGFDAVDSGSLDQSWRQQPGMPAYAADLDSANLRRALGEAVKDRKPEWKAA